MYFMGIDAGGTHCRAMLVDESGKLLGRGEGGPANTVRGSAVVFDSVSKASRMAISNAQATELTPPDIALCIGIAGASRKDVLSQVLAYPYMAAYACVDMVSDAEIALIGAHGNRDGGIVIVGTGTVGFARVAGHTFQVGGWGFPASDRGSGAYIGMRAAQFFLDVQDGIKPATAFSCALSELLGNDGTPVKSWGGTDGATHFAALAPLVVDYCVRQDPEASLIMHDSAKHVAEIVRALNDKGAQRISMGGGLSQSIYACFDESVKSLLVAPEGDPIMGALYLARIAGNNKVR